MIKEAAAEYEYLTGDEALQRIAFLKRKYELDHNSMMVDAREKGLEEGKREGLEQGIKEGREVGIKEGKKEGIREGIKEGEKNAKIKIAERMLELGAEINFIISVTGLTKEDIKNLKKKE